MKIINIEEKRARAFKRTILKVIQMKKELSSEKVRNFEMLKLSVKPRLETDLLKKLEIEKEYGISQKTIDRMRERGLKTSQSSPKAIVWIVRKDFEDFLKKDRYDR